MDRDTKEADMSKSPIKKIPKQQTRLKINQKKSRNWQMGKRKRHGSRRSNHVLATNMRKRKEGKKIDAPENVLTKETC